MGTGSSGQLTSYDDRVLGKKDLETTGKFPVASNCYSITVIAIWYVVPFIFVEIFALPFFLA